MDIQRVNRNENAVRIDREHEYGIFMKPRAMNDSPSAIALLSHTNLSFERFVKIKEKEKDREGRER